jgi:hypothetical protein
MQAEVFWTCACGIKVQAVLDMTKVSAIVRCPNARCSVTRTLPGQIIELGVETTPGLWNRDAGYRAYLTLLPRIDESPSINLLVRSRMRKARMSFLDVDATDARSGDEE